MKSWEIDIISIVKHENRCSLRFIQDLSQHLGLVKTPQFQSTLENTKLL